MQSEKDIGKIQFSLSFYDNKNSLVLTVSLFNISGNFKNVRNILFL